MLGNILDGAVLFLYPLIILAGMTYLGVRLTALLLLLLLGRRIIGMIIRNREQTRILLYQALAMAAIIAIAGLVASPLALRIAPFVISLTFIVLFAGSLRTTPIIERFARLQKPDLPAPEVAYCRSLTKVWVAVLAANSALVLGAAFIRDEVLWTLVVGPLSYGLLGAVFAVEYPYRKWRFQDFDATSPIDRLLSVFLLRR